jgi:hypothetical protein
VLFAERKKDGLVQVEIFDPMGSRVLNISKTKIKQA